MPPDRQQRPSVRSPRSAAAAGTDDTTPQYPTTTTGAPIWYLEAEASIRDAARKLEVIGVTDADAARLAGALYRFASRVRTDRTVAV